jgi:hypothetical protein
MPDHTYTVKEENSMPGLKAAKDHITLLLGENAVGIAN